MITNLEIKDPSKKKKKKTTTTTRKAHISKDHTGSGGAATNSEIDEWK